MFEIMRLLIFVWGLFVFLTVQICTNRPSCIVSLGVVNEFIEYDVKLSRRHNQSSSGSMRLGGQYGVLVMKSALLFEKG